MSGDLSAINNGDWVLCILRREPRQSLIIHSLPARSTPKIPWITAGECIIRYSWRKFSLLYCNRIHRYEPSRIISVSILSDFSFWKLVHQRKHRKF